MRWTNIWLVLWILSYCQLAWGDIELAPSSTGDDTVALTRAVAAGGEIRLKSGTYKISKTLVIELEKTGPVSIVAEGTVKVDMAGEGPALLFRGTHNGTADPTTVTALIWEKERMPMVRGIEFTSSHPNGDAIAAEGTMQLALSQLLIREVRHGIHLRKRNRNVAIDQVHIYNNRGIGIFLDQVNLHQTNITGSHISYNKLGGVVIDGGDVRNVHITGCDIEANMSESQGYRANVWVECVRGSGAEIVISGCTIQHTAAVPDSSNIIFNGGGEVKDGEATRWGHLTIANNILTDAQRNIWLKNARGVTITGNSFGEGHQQHLLIEKSESVSIGSNVFDRNPPYYTTKAKDSQDVLLFRDCQNCVLQGLLLNGIASAGGSIQLEHCSGMNLQGCSILEHGPIGLSFIDCRDCIISGCMFRAAKGQSAISISETGGEGNEIQQTKAVSVQRKP